MIELTILAKLTYTLIIVAFFAFLRSASENFGIVTLLSRLRNVIHQRS